MELMKTDGSRQQVIAAGLLHKEGRPTRGQRQDLAGSIAIKALNL
jgi:hypothetical protein